MCQNMNERILMIRGQKLRLLFFEEMMTYQILIVDDREVVRKQLRDLLDLTGIVSVTGEAVDGWDALRQAKALKPDIVLMDLKMPELDGFEATRQMKTLNLAKVVIVFTVYADDANKLKAMESGADAFIAKGTDLATLLNVFENTMNRETDLPGVSEKM
jgi:DNA-binding NarL/FixJ family response regulator